MVGEWCACALAAAAVAALLSFIIHLFLRRCLFVFRLTILQWFEYFFKARFRSHPHQCLKGVRTLVQCTRYTTNYSLDASFLYVNVQKYLQLFFLRCYVFCLLLCSDRLCGYICFSFFPLTRNIFGFKVALIKIKRCEKLNLISTNIENSRCFSLERTFRASKKRRARVQHNRTLTRGYLF